MWLSGMSLRAALAWLVLTVLAAIACQKWLFPESAAQFYFPVVVVSSLLVSSTTAVAKESCKNNFRFLICCLRGNFRYFCPKVGKLFLHESKVIEPAIKAVLGLGRDVHQTDVALGADS